MAAHRSFPSTKAIITSKKMNMRSIELFSGAGGLAMGLEKAGFNSVAHVEKDVSACETLRLNRPSWNVIQSDVRDIDFQRFSPIDLIAGGPPCQPFSMGGKARGFKDSRDMFPEAVRAVRELAPNAFIFENVRGLLRPRFSRYVEYIRLQLTHPDFPLHPGSEWESNLAELQKHHLASLKTGTGLRYTVSVQLADAADYGVPQRRLRVFFTGIRSDLGSVFTFPHPTHSREELLRSKYISNEYWKRLGISPKEPETRDMDRICALDTCEPIFRLKAWKTLREAIHDLPAPQEGSAIPNHRHQPGAKVYPGHTGSPLDEPSKALKAGDHGVPGGENMIRFSDGTVRYLTIREAARIQTFPDDFVFPGSWTESMRQLGNAVPVRLARIVAQSIAEAIRLRANSNVTHATISRAV